MRTFNFLTLILISFKSAVFISFNFRAIFYILYLMADKIPMTKRITCELFSWPVT